MITTNEGLPDIEKLERHEFILDTDEYQRIQAEDNELVLKEREKNELGNLASMFLRDQIKVECWESMSVKGKILKVRVIASLESIVWRDSFNWYGICTSTHIFTSCALLGPCMRFIYLRTYSETSDSGLSDTQHNNRSQLMVSL